MSKWFGQRPSISPLHLAINRRPKGVPPAYWRRVLGLRIWAFLYIVGNVGLVVITIGMRSFGALQFVTVFLAFMVLAILLSFAPGRINRRLRRDVLAAEYRLCFQCGYSLEQLPDQHRCPECGAAYTFAQLRDDWLDWYVKGPGRR